MGTELQKQPLSAAAQQLFSPAAMQLAMALKFAVCDSDDVREAEENHLALEAHG
jgi:hypothetical protein